MLMNAFCINTHISQGLVPYQHLLCAGHVGKSVTQFSFVGGEILVYAALCRKIQSQENVSKIRQLTWICIILMYVETTCNVASWVTASARREPRK